MSSLQHPVSRIEIQLETTQAAVFSPVISAELRGFSRYLAKLGSFVTLGCKCFCGSWHVSSGGRFRRSEDAVVLQRFTEITFVLNSCSPFLCCELLALQLAQVAAMPGECFTLIEKDHSEVNLTGVSCVCVCCFQDWDQHVKGKLHLQNCSLYTER